ncbi:hypothetical protein HRbin29_01646 [bacterium HR29]|jgi:hypothetical protein|nr:hypothetical protein HRbin29_01646 [bacterium HR29]
MGEEARLAPDQTITSVVSGRQVRLRQPGAALVLIFTNQTTADRATALRTALRERFPDPSAVVIASVVDVSGVPRLMRKMAEGALANRYRELAAALGPGRDPAQYLVMCPDWDGKLPSAFGLSGLESRLGVAVVDASGGIVGTAVGDDLLPAVEALVAPLLA